ncbi:MAG: acyltransferase family protein [Bosea sp. (in: a-proteobacteria)]
MAEASSWWRGQTISAAMAREHDNFGLLRLVLALAVVYSHAFSVVSGRIDDEPLTLLTGFTLGEHAVNGFFAISGFLVTMSYDRRGWRDYLVARTLRIAPGLIAAVLVVALGFGLLLTTQGTSAYLSDARLWRFITATLTSFKSNIALPGVFATNPFSFPMGTVWTLKYETICYAGVFGIGLVGLFRYRALLLGAAIALTLAVIAREILTPHGPKGIETSLRLPLIFFCGGLAWLWRDRFRVSGAGVLLALAAVIILSPTPLYKAALYLATTYAMLALALAPEFTRHHSEPPGDISYGVYLYGWPVQQALVQLFPAAGAWALMGPAFVLTALIAVASWLLVEKPALGLKKRLIRA